MKRVRTNLPSLGLMDNFSIPQGAVVAVLVVVAAVAVVVAVAIAVFSCGSGIS